MAEEEMISFTTDDGRVVAVPRSRVVAALAQAKLPDFIQSLTDANELAEQRGISGPSKVMKWYLAAKAGEAPDDGSVGQGIAD